MYIVSKYRPENNNRNQCLVLHHGKNVIEFQHMQYCNVYQIGAPCITFAYLKNTFCLVDSSNTAYN